MHNLNRRSAPRVQRTLDIRYVSPGSSVQSGAALDISRGGARLVLDSTEAEDLTIEFQGKVALLARKVWSRPLQGGKQEVGVIFEGLHWGLRVALDNYVSELEHQAQAA